MLWAISRVVAPRFVVMREQTLRAHLNCTEIRGE